MKLLFILCLLLAGCTIDATFEQKPKKAQKPQVEVLNTEAVKVQSRFLQKEISVAEYKHGTTTYLIFKCGDQLFVQKVEDTTSGK